jgi:O-antigen/teichoic acid export membrane protein
MNFRNRLGLTVFVNIFLACISFGTSVLAARLLGANGRGELTAIWIYPILISNLALLGLPEALVYFTARQPDSAGRLLTTCIFTGLSITIPVLLAAYYLLPKLLDAQSVEIISYARFFLLYIPINAMVGFFSLSLRGKNDLGYWNLTRTLPPIMWFSLLLFTQITINKGSAGKLSILYLLLLLVSGIFAMIVVKKRISGPFRPDLTQLKPMVKYGIPALFGTLPSVLNLRLDQIVMAGYIVPEKLGLYVTAVGYSGISISITSALASMIVPDIAGTGNEKDKEEKMVRSFRLGSLIAVGMVLALAVSASWAIPLIYGDEFISVVPVSMILCLATGIAGINVVLENGMLGLGYPVYVFISEIGGLVITVLC